MSFAAFQKRMAADQGRIHWQPEHFQTLAKVYKISEEQVAKAVTPGPVVSSLPEMTTKSAPADAQRSFKWTMNDGEIDRAGDIVVASGVDTSHFRSNPIALLQHDPSKPIGTWSNVHADGGKLKGTLNLAPTRLGEHVRENIAAGVLKAASIGFVPIAFEPITKGGFRFTKIELMETSVVSIPASRGSLRERSFSERQDDRRQQATEMRAKAARDHAAVDAVAVFNADAERKRSYLKPPEAAAAEAKLAASSARGRERDLIAGMNPKQHADYLNLKAKRKEQRQQRLRELRGAIMTDAEAYDLITTIAKTEKNQAVASQLVEDMLAAHTKLLCEAAARHMLAMGERPRLKRSTMRVTKHDAKGRILATETVTEEQ